MNTLSYSILNLPLLSILMILSTCSVRAQNGSNNILVVGGGTLIQTLNADWPAHSASGTTLTPQPIDHSTGYSFGIGWGHYWDNNAKPVVGYAGIRLRFQRVEYARSEKGMLLAPSSFFKAIYTYSGIRTVRSIGVGVPVSLVFKPAAWCELQCGMEIIGSVGLEDTELGHMTTTTEHYWLPSWELAYTTTSTHAVETKPIDPEKSKPWVC